MYNNLFSVLGKYYPLSDKLKERIVSILQTIEVKKKTRLLSIGQMSNHIYFIESGLIRICYLKDGAEICSALIAEGKMALSVHSFFERMPSYEFIETCEKCILHYISHQDLEQLYQDFFEFNIVGRKLITENYGLSEQRNYMLRGQQASKKIEYFMEKYGELVMRAPRKDIASFLGITLETLGRVGY